MFYVIYSALWGKHCIVLWDVLVLPLVVRARTNNQVKVISSCLVSASEWRKTVLRWMWGAQPGTGAVRWMSRVNWRREEPWWGWWKRAERRQKHVSHQGIGCVAWTYCDLNSVWFYVFFTLWYLGFGFLRPLFLPLSLHFNFNTTWNLPATFCSAELQASEKEKKEKEEETKEKVFKGETRQATKKAR